MDQKFLNFINFSQHRGKYSTRHSLWSTLYNVNLLLPDNNVGSEFTPIQIPIQIAAAPPGDDPADRDRADLPLLPPGRPDAAGDGYRNQS